MIQLQNISKQFSVNKKIIQAVNNATLHINQGDIFGVVGYSGAGKSTLIRCVNLLERPEKGQVIINGVDITTLNKKDLQKTRRKIGMIFQGYNLLQTATVLDNITIPLILEGIDKTTATARAEKYLEIVGLEDKHQSYPNQLSGGQKQRVAIARALAHEPEILLSDEATSALDPETTESILKLLLKINTELGITIFLITHELEVVQRICDKVAVMEQGEIIEQGDVLTVFTTPENETTRRFVASQTKFEIPNDILANYKASGKLVSLRFVGDVTGEPVLAELTKKYDVLPSILAGGITHFKNGQMGKLLVHLKGSAESYAEAIKYLQQVGVFVSEITEDVSNSSTFEANKGV